MISEIKDYENLGNSLYKMNYYFNIFNVRADNLMSDAVEYNKMATEFKQLSANLNEFTNIVQNTSATWKRSSDLVFNLQGYWEEPIFFMYKNTFNMVANWLEIENWLNENFPAENFSSTQILKCGYTCKNFNADVLEGTRIYNFDQNTLEGIAASYSVTVKEIVSYINYKNQVDGILSLLNSTLRRTFNADFVVLDISDTSIDNYIKYNKNTDLFYSDELSNLTQNQAITIHALITQIKFIRNIYNGLVAKGVNLIPTEILSQFFIKNILILNTGYFHFKIKNNKWSYHAYGPIEFCSQNICSDCYDIIDINNLYGDKECYNSVKYLLTECLVE